jgi:hypothetical protein
MGYRTLAALRTLGHPITLSRSGLPFLKGVDVHASCRREAEQSANVRRGSMEEAAQGFIRQIVNAVRSTCNQRLHGFSSKVRRWHLYISPTPQARQFLPLREHAGLLAPGL